jgi:hypothetical protein
MGSTFIPQLFCVLQFLYRPLLFEAQESFVYFVGELKRLTIW